jgi:23S rRNA (uracil1939-C5)-methyltransferase
LPAKPIDLPTRPIELGERFEVTINKIVPGGLGIGFYEGNTIFVPLAAPGDKLRVVMSRTKGRSVFAEIEEVLEPSNERVEPECRYFGTCGGCDFMQLGYDAQLRAKVGIIRDCLERIGKIDFQDEIKAIGSPEPFGYRLRAQWHMDTSKPGIGYYRRNSRDLVDVEKCLVLAPSLERELARLRRMVPDASEKFVTAKIDAACGDNESVSVYSEGAGFEAEDIEIDAASERYRFSAKTFFQGNRYLIDKLVETALGDAAGESALDLYCGVGLFTLPMARRFGSVVGVEDNRSAIEYAKRNAKAAELDNIEFRVANVRKYLASADIPKADLVLLDPPRFGTERDTMENLIRMRPAHVAYVACEPSILARDLKRFDAAGYEITSITAIDLFPQTHHVETVVHLRSRL